jgi:hypothetical protein
MPKRRQKRRVVKQSELFKLIKYLIPKEKQTTPGQPYLDPRNFQTRSGYLSPYLIPSAEQKVVHDSNKAYITIKQNEPSVVVENKEQKEVKTIEPSGDEKTDLKRKTLFVRQAFEEKKIKKPSSTILEAYNGGTIQKTYQAIIDGKLNWIGLQEYNNRDRKQPAN